MESFIQIYKNTAIWFSDLSFLSIFSVTFFLETIVLFAPVCINGASPCHPLTPIFHSGEFELFWVIIIQQKLPTILNFVYLFHRFNFRLGNFSIIKDSFLKTLIKNKIVSIALSIFYFFFFFNLWCPFLRATFQNCWSCGICERFPVPSEFEHHLLLVFKNLRVAWLIFSIYFNTFLYFIYYHPF